MKRAFSLILISSLSVFSTASVFAQDEDVLSDVVDVNTEVTTSADTDDLDTTLNAANNPTAVNAVSTRHWEYKEVACSSDVVFSQNSCNQCFIGSTVKVGEKKTDLFDNWRNNTTDVVYTAVKSEQKTPELVSFGSKWVPSNADESKMWIFHTDVSESFFPGANGWEEFALNPGQEVRFYQTSLGAGYTLESTTKNNGEVVGMLKFPVVYYTQNISGEDRSTSPETHYECVSYSLEKEEAPAPTPNKPTTPEVTKTETGPAQTLVLIVAAFFIAFGLMISLRKRS